MLAARIHFFALPLLLVVYLYGLSNVGLIGPDEPRYASVGREMAETGDYVTPHLWGEAWFEKPPLLYWLIAGGFNAGLTDELAVRVPVSLVGAGFLVFFFFRMRREFGETAAWYSVAVLATSAGWLAYSHVAVTDIVLSATFCGCVLLCLPWIRSGGRRGLFLAGLLLGFAVLAKGFVPLVLVLPVFWEARKNWRDLGIFVLTAGAIAAPWFLACFAANGQAFLHEFVYVHHIGRFFEPDLQHLQPFWFYAPVVCGLLFPWTFSAVVLFRPAAYKDGRVRLMGLIVVLGIVFFSLSRNKLPGYVLPLLPLLAALIGVQFSTMRSSPLVLALSALLLVLAPIVARVLPVALLQGARRATITLGNTDLLAMALVVVLAGVCWRLERQGRRPVCVALISGAVCISVLLLKTFTFPAIDATATARPLWIQMRTAGAAIPCVANVPRSLRYGLNYYADRKLPECVEPPVTPPTPPTPP